MFFSSKNNPTGSLAKDLVAQAAKMPVSDFSNDCQKSSAFLNALQLIQSKNISGIEARKNEALILGQLLAEPKAMNDVLKECHGNKIMCKGKPFGRVRNALGVGLGSGLMEKGLRSLEAQISFDRKVSDLDPVNKMPVLLKALSRPDAVKSAVSLLNTRIQKLASHNPQLLLIPGDGMGKAKESEGARLRKMKYTLAAMDHYLASTNQSSLKRSKKKIEKPEERNRDTGEFMPISSQQAGQDESLKNLFSENGLGAFPKTEKDAQALIARLEQEASEMMPQSESDWTPERIQALSENLQQRNPLYETLDQESNQ